MSGKVYLNGMHLEASGAYSAPSFLSDLARAGVRQFEHSDRRRIIFVEAFGKYTIGGLFSDKAQSHYLTLEQDNAGQYSVKIEQTAGGRPMFDFTLFAVRTSTGRGLFSQYQGSGGITVFGNILHKQFKQCSAEACETCLEELEESGFDEGSDQYKTARRDYRQSKLTTVLMMKDPSFSIELQRVAEFGTFEYAEATVADPAYTSVKKQVQLVRHKYAFKKIGQNPTLLRKFINNLVLRREIKTGTVVGKDTHGKTFDVPIDYKAYSFFSEPLATALREDNFRRPGLHTSPLINQMIQIMDTQKLLFQ